MTAQTKLPIEELKQFENTPDEQLLELNKVADDFLNDTFAKPEPPKPEPAEKKTRSKKKSEPAPPPPPQPETKNLFNDQEFTKTGPETQQQATTKINVAEIVDPELAVDLFDKLMTIIIPLGLNAVGNMNLKPSDMAATPKEKKTLQGPVHNALRTLNLDLSNPWVALSFSVAIIYGGKAAAKVNFTDDMVNNESSAPAGSMRGMPKPHHSDKKAYQKWYRDNRK